VASVDRRGSEGERVRLMLSAPSNPDLTGPAMPSRWATSPRRWPRPRLTPTILAALQDRYQLSWRGHPVDLGGSSNLNLHLPGEEGGYVMRVHRSWVSGPRLTAIQDVRSRLVRAGLPFLEPIETLDKRGWLELDGHHLLEVEKYVSGEDMEMGDRLLAAMPTLARIHDELSRIDAGAAARQAPSASHVEARLVLDSTRKAAAAIRAWAASPEEHQIATLSERLAGELRMAERPYVAVLPRQLVHGDFWHNNVRFRDLEVVAVLDLDFMEERPRIDDLALTLYYVNSTLGPDHGGSDRVAALGSLVRAYDGALERPLSSAERAALPFAIARTVLAFTRHLALRDGEDEQREVAMAWLPDLGWSLEMVRDAARWQEAFAAS
jgi:Ser/Thr protein kinase RdoA (MazF antagonist)